MKKNCPQCGDELVDKYSCQCGWFSKNRQALIEKECAWCHVPIDNKYFRIFRNKRDGTEKLKCANCLVYIDLEWYDKVVSKNEIALLFVVLIVQRRPSNFTNIESVALTQAVFPVPSRLDKKRHRNATWHHWHYKEVPWRLA